VSAYHKSEVYRVCDIKATLDPLREILVGLSLKMTVLPSGTLDLEKFRHGTSTVAIKG